MYVTVLSWIVIVKWLNSSIHTAKSVHCGSELNILRKGETNSVKKDVNSPQIMQSIVPHLPKYVTNSHLRKTAFFL